MNALQNAIELAQKTPAAWGVNQLQNFGKNVISSVGNWATPPPVSPVAEQPAQSLFQPGGIKQAVNNVVAYATLQPERVRPFNTAYASQQEQPNMQRQPTPTAVPTALSNAYKDFVAKTTPIPTVTPGQIKQEPVVEKPVQKEAIKIDMKSFSRNPDIQKYTISEPVKNALLTAAETFKIPVSLLSDIALQESGFRPTSDPYAEGGGEIFKQAGYPKGLFQFTDGTWQTVLNYEAKPGSSLKLPNHDRFDPLTNALAAAYLIKFGQLGRWDASKHNWGRFYSPEELNSYYAQRK